MVVDKVDDMLGESVIKGLDLSPDYGNVEYTPQYQPNTVPPGSQNPSAPDNSAVTEEEVKNKILTWLKNDGYENVTIEENNIANPSSPGGYYIKSNGQNLAWLNFYGTTYTISSINTELFPQEKVEKLRTYISGGTAEEWEESTGGTQISEDIREIMSKQGKMVKVSTSPSKVLYFTNYARMYLNVKDKDQYLPMSTAYLIIYIALITFTAVFTVRYIKRVIYVAFLTLMAPMVALTYPIDKIKDRKSTSMEYVV